MVCAKFSPRKRHFEQFFWSSWGPGNTRKKAESHCPLPGPQKTFFIQQTPVFWQRNYTLLSGIVCLSHHSERRWYIRSWSAPCKWSLHFIHHPKTREGEWQMAWCDVVTPMKFSAHRRWSLMKESSVRFGWQSINQENVYHRKAIAAFYKLSW